MSFHSAHGIVSRAVRELDRRYDPDAMAAIVEREVQGKYLISRDVIRGALSAKNFVAVRKIPGGPARESLEPEIVRARSAVVSDQRWLEQREHMLAEARQVIRNECNHLMGQVDGY
jgi:argininosuccinate lyase